MADFAAEGVSSATGLSSTEETRLALSALPSVFADLPRGVNKHVFRALKIDEKTGLSTLPDPAAAFPPPKRRRVLTNGWEEGNIYLARQVHLLTVARSTVAQLVADTAMGVASSLGPAASAAGVPRGFGEAPTAPGPGGVVMGYANDPARRVYVGSLDYVVTESDMLAILTSVVGPVVRIEMPRDSSTGSTKGFCFADFLHASDAARALQILPGYLVNGRPLRANLPKAVPIAVGSSQCVPLAAQVPTAPPAVTHGPPLAGSAPLGAPPGAGPGGATECRVFVACIAPEYNEEHLKTIFSAFGEIRSVQLLMDSATGRHKGHGFIEFANEAAAKMAMEQFDGQKLGQRNIVVRPANSRTNVAAASAAPAQQQQQQLAPAATPMGTASAAFAYPSAPAATPTPAVATGVGAGAVDGNDDDGCCSVRLRNMLTDKDLAESSLDELRTEVSEECCQYGRLLTVDLTQPDPQQPSEVDVYLRYSTPAEARWARQKLHDRRFAERKIIATLEDLDGTPLR
jgi:hypothetical protein